MMVPYRRPDWRPRLVAFIEEVRTRPFAWGSHDCALFVAGAVEAMTGYDGGAVYRGQYDSFRGGLKRLKREAVSGLIDLVARHFDPVPPALAQVGDIAVIGEVGTPAMGIFEGETILVLRDEGLGLVPRAAASKAFRVP